VKKEENTKEVVIEIKGRISIEIER